MPTLGIIFHPRFPPETVMEYARRAEAGGFSELWFWDDCFLPGVFTLAGMALAATDRIKVGIGLIPATAYNPLFATMEITSLASAFPGRFMPGFGHGVDVWMKQIGAAPVSSMKRLEQTVLAVRGLLRGERVSVDAHGVYLDGVQMELVPDQPPPLYIGAMREKSLQLAGRVADGTILTGMSAPAYVTWAREQIRAGLGGDAFGSHRVVVYRHAKVSPDGQSARAMMRRCLGAHFGTWADVHLKALGILEEAQALHQRYGADAVNQIPDAWMNELSSSGTPEQAAMSIQRLSDAGADTVILQPLDGDADCLDEYIRYLMPLFQ